MSDKDDALYLDHIGESIDLIREHVVGGRESFLAPGIVHDYLASFDLNLAWTFIENDLPSLKAAVDEELHR